ncbi:hypothetical protein [Streptomyces rhizosphaerihabitans]|uniref:hypothetical protein n=1 Tax=Streptomyces rhizosphaerihabitans TaxID=1266770 RepID=UPI0021C0DCFD|nr:hypothetical protein [Streptomyces rhizosphaerihabitans]MCT9005498.1 hypothetical protein [Streptomyces rhizosphaerihabitans]
MDGHLTADPLAVPVRRDGLPGPRPQHQPDPDERDIRGVDRAAAEGPPVFAGPAVATRMAPFSGAMDRAERGAS